MLLIEPNTPSWWKRAVLLFDHEYKPSYPPTPERLYAVATMADLPDPAKWPDCVAIARNTGLVWSNGVAWSAV